MGEIKAKLVRTIYPQNNLPWYFTKKAEKRLRQYFDVINPKEGKAIWWIKVLEKGTAPQTLTECEDEEAEVYSDTFEIDADYVWHEVKSL